MPAVEITGEFIDAMTALDPGDAKRVSAFLGKLVLAPDSTSLRPEIVHDAADRSIRSFKVTHDLRAIARMVGDRITLLFVARHDRAYVRARAACYECASEPVVGIVTERGGAPGNAWVCSTLAELCHSLSANGIMHDLRP